MLNLNEIAARIGEVLEPFDLELKLVGNRETLNFEIATLFSVLNHYRAHRFQYQVLGPGWRTFEIKKSPKGYPGAYSFFRIWRDGQLFDIYQNLSVMSCSCGAEYCVDVAVAEPNVYPSGKNHGSWLPLANKDLVSFVEAKKLAVFPMLIAQFLGQVHEIRADFLRGLPNSHVAEPAHLLPLLVTNGRLSQNSKKIVDSLTQRRIKVCVRDEFESIATRLLGNPTPLTP